MDFSTLKVVPILNGKRPGFANWPNMAKPMGEWGQQSARWGLVHGPANGTWALDLDTKGAVSGLDSLAELEARYGKLPPTLMVRTPSGGLHLIFLWPEDGGIGNPVGLRPGIDARGEAGQTLIPPSPGYEWDTSHATEPAEAPGWLLALVRGEEEETGSKVILDPTAYKEAALKRLSEIAPGESKRQRTTYTVAKDLGRLCAATGWRTDEIILEVSEAARQNGLEEGRIAETVERAVLEGYELGGFQVAPAVAAPGNLFANFALVEQPRGGFVVARYVGKDHVQPVLDPLIIERDLCRQGAQPRDTRRLIDQWKKTTTTVPEPAVIAMPHEPGLAWCRLPFDLPAPEGPEAWPAWQEFVGRVSDPTFFMAWLGSVFDVGSRSRQIVWLRGDGEDGKSTVFRTLYGILGTCMATIPDAGMGEDGKRFLAFTAYGHRLVAITDCRNTKILRMSVVRHLTSGDLVNIEAKGKDGFTAVTWTKLAICSNDPPDISTSKADLSRAVLLEVAPAKNTSDAKWEMRLAEQAPAFLAACLWTYAEVCPERGRIPVSEQAARDTLEAAQDSEADTETIARKLLTFGEGLEVRIGELREEAKERFRLNQFELNDLVRWLEGPGGLQRGRNNRGKLLKGAELK